MLNMNYSKCQKMFAYSCRVSFHLSAK